MRLKGLVTSAVALVLITGCAGGSAQTSPARHQAAVARTAATVRDGSSAHQAGRGRLLVLFRRVFGTDPMASQLTIYTSGDAVAVLGFGGINGSQVHRFRVPPAELRRLRALVAGTRLSTTDCCDVRHYIYWVITSRASRRLQESSIPRASRPLISELNGMTDAHTGW